MIRIDESKWLSVCWDWGLNGEGHLSISFGNKKDGEHGIFSVGLLWGGEGVLGRCSNPSHRPEVSLGDGDNLVQQDL